MLDTLAVVVEHTPVAIAMFDRQMRYILANRQWVKEFNLSQAIPLVGKSQYEVFPKLHPGWKQLYERALQGYTMRSDHAVPVASGAAPILFRCEARPWRQKRDASVAGIVVICNKYVGAPSSDTAGADAPSTEAFEVPAEEKHFEGSAHEAISELDMSSAEVPVFVLDEAGRVVAANGRAGELSLARGIEEGQTALWDILEDEERRPAMKHQFQEYVSRMADGEDGVPQILTVKSASQTYSNRNGSAVAPSRWLVARQGGASGRWLALGLTGLSPFVSTAKIGIHLPATTTGSAPFTAVPPVVATTSSADMAAMEQLRQEKLKLQLELSEANDTLRQVRAEMRMLRDAENTLARRETLQQAVVEGLPAGVLVLDEAGRVVQQNQALRALLGHELRAEETVETWLGRSCPNEEHRSEVCRIWREDVWRRQLTRTVSLVTADGLLKEIELRPGALVQNGLLVHFQDVTAACRLEEQLSAMEAKFKALLQENPLPVLISDKSGNVFDLNRAAEELFQKHKVELKRLPVDALLSASGVAARKDALREMKQSGDNRHRLTVALAGENAPKMHLSMAAIRSADGMPHGTLHFFETPVSWAAAEAAPAIHAAQPTFLEPREAVLPLTVEVKETAPVLLVATGVNGRIQTWTDAAGEVFGFSREEALGRPLHELFQPSNASGFYGVTLPKAIEAGSAEWTYFSREGGKREGQFSVRAGGSGGPQVEIWQVAGKAEEVEAAVESAVAAEAGALTSSLPSRPEWAISDLSREQALLSEAHHRIRHHLNILSSLVNVQSNAMTDSGAKDALRSTQDRLKAVAELHHHLEALAAKPEASYRLFVTGLVSRIQESLGVSSTRVKVGLEIPDELTLPKEWLMPVALILNETVSNALEHGFPDDREGKVRVKLTMDGAKASLVVEDDGIGMPEEVNAAAERGLGLKMVSVFVEQMRGKLLISGAGEKGTRIEVQFFIAFTDN
jgi:PAS domain S-box-containing protein